MRILASAALFVMLLKAHAVPQEQTNKVTIEGIVTRADSGQPIAGARLMISRLAVNAQGNLVRVAVASGPPRGTPPTTPAAVPQTNVITDVDGKFVFTNLDPGMYRVIASADGFVRREYGQRSIAAGLGSGTLIDLTSGQSMKNAAIRLTPTGTVRGRIVDDAGQPAVKVPIQLLQFPYDATGVKTLRQMATGSTDDRGEYRIYGLTPGRYFVAMGNGAGPVPSGRQTPAVLYAYQYFPGVRDAGQASVVEIKSGGEAVADMRAARLQLRSIRGSVVDLTGQPNANTAARGPSFVSISLSFAWDSTNNIDSCGCVDASRSYDPATGKFEAKNVIPGAYTARASMPDAKSRIDAQTTGILALNQHTISSNNASIVVGDSDVEGVVLTFTNPVSIPGKLSVEGQGSAVPVQGIRFQYRSSNSGVPDSIAGAMQATIDANGTFRVDGMHAGEYLATVVGVPPALYVKSLQFDGKDLLGNPLEFSGSSAGEIHIVLSSDGGQVNGIVTDSTMKPAAGVQAVIIPEMKRNRPDLYKSKITHPDGRFSITGVAPGDYRVFAWDGMEPFRYFDPDFLTLYEAKGKSIHVGEATTVSADVQVIPIPQE